MATTRHPPERFARTVDLLYISRTDSCCCCCDQRTIHPSTQQTQNIVWHLYNVGPTFSTLERHCTNVIQRFCVCWDSAICDNKVKTIPQNSGLKTYSCGKVMSLLIYFLTFLHYLQYCIILKHYIIFSKLPVQRPTRCQTRLKLNCQLYSYFTFQNWISLGIPRYSYFYYE